MSHDTNIRVLAISDKAGGFNRSNDYGRTFKKKLKF